MGGPSDFGLSPLRTLSRVADPLPHPEFSVFWQLWKKRLQDPRPELVARAAGGAGAAAVDPSDESATHGFVSLGGVRIGARLLLPPAGVPVRAGLVTTHGYAAAGLLAERDALFTPVRALGVAVLCVRVRGYAGSRLDVGDLTSGGGEGMGWITRGLDAAGESAEATLSWVWPQAVADVYNACRALRWHLEGMAAGGAAWGGEAPGVYLHGESFGGGLAVAAAAMLTGRERERTGVSRLVISLPTMGDWPWRLSNPAGSGMGAQVAALLRERPAQAERIVARLRVCDSVPLAMKIRCPVLCKLALRDEVVPAPSAAAVFNALGVDPGHKWRFVVPVGHAEAGLANARRHAEFDRCATDFLDPATDPERRMLAWESRLSADVAMSPPPAAATLFAGLGVGAGGGAGAGVPGDEGDAARPAGAAERALLEAYERAGRTLDDLPYTSEFEALFAAVAPALHMDRAGVLHRLQNLRKAGRLPKLGRAVGKPPRISAEDEVLLTDLVAEAAGSLGQRDRLPYSAAFDALLQRFNERTGRSLDPHAAWRVIARVAK